MNNNKFNLRKLNKVLFILLILLIGTTVRVYPYYQYSQDPNSYQGEQSYRSNYLLDNGHALPSQRGEVILDKLNAIKKIIINPSPKQNLLIVSLFQSLAFSLVIYLFARNFSKEIDIWTTGLIFAFSISATPDIIGQLLGWNGPYTWIFIMIFIYFSMCKPLTAFTTFSSLLPLLLLPPTYYTISLLFALFMLLSIILQTLYNVGLLNKNFHVFTKNIALLYGVFIISWLMYMSHSGFNFLFNVIDFTQSYFQQESRILTLDYIAYGSKISMAENAISIILSSTPFLYILYYGRKYVDSRIYNFYLITLGAIFIMSLILYLWMGITGIFQRIPGYVSLFSVLAFSLLSASKMNPSHFKILKIIITISIFISTFTYLTSDYIPEKPTFSEAEGAHWLIQKMYKGDLTYTDFRLSALFIAKGYPTLYIQDQLSPKKVNLLLENIYYNVNPSTAKVLTQLTANDKPIKYIYFSNRYTKRFPGIKGFDYNYLPAPKNFIEKYESQKEFNVIYKNADTTILTFNN